MVNKATVGPYVGCFPRGETDGSLSFLYIDIYLTATSSKAVDPAPDPWSRQCPCISSIHLKDSMQHRASDRGEMRASDSSLSRAVKKKENCSNSDIQGMNSHHA